jgi:hypothetical protein
VTWLGAHVNRKTSWKAYDETLQNSLERKHPRKGKKRKQGGKKILLGSQ